MIAAIDGFLKPLDWRLRAGMSAAFAALAAAVMAYGLRSSSLGPWLLAVFCGISATLSVWMSQKAWPGKLPAAAGLVVDKWKTARGKATKSGSGRFMWGLGRLAVGAFIASHATGWIPGASDELRWVVMLGFGVSYGFFGLEAAMWGMLVVSVASHAALSFGMGLDASDPVARRAFSEAWAGGASVSWFWAFAFALTPFLWIGVSAAIGRTKKAIVRAAKKRRDESAAQRKIDARRLRLSGAPGIGGETALDKARIKLEEAKSRLRSFDKGGTISDGSDASASAEGGKELTGVEKLENDNLVGTLRLYVAQVANIRHVDSQGRGQGVDLDVDTPARRGFERVIMALGDNAIELMRKDQTGEYKDLLEFYLELFKGEASVLRGSDGEIVTSVSMAPAYDEEDDIDGISGSGWNVQLPPSDELGALGDVMDDEEVDIPPPSAPPQPEYEPEQQEEEEVEREEPVMMLAPSAEEPSEPIEEEPLPLEDDVDDVETSSMHQETVTDPEAVEHDRDEDSDHGVVGAVSDAVEPMPAAVVEGGSVDVDGVRSGDDDLDDREAVEPDSAEHEPEEDADPDRVDAQDGSAYEDAAQPPEEAATEAASPVDADDGTNVRAVTPDEQGSDQIVSDAGVPSAAELKAAATKILMMRTPREMVVSSAGWFSSTFDLAAAMGIDDDDDFSEPFGAYHSKVAAFGLENQLRSIFASASVEEDADRIDAAVSALTAAGWDHDDALVAESAERATALRDEARVKRELEAAELARAEEERIEADRVAAAAVAQAAEAAAAAAQAIADAAEKARIEAAAEAAAEAERLAAAERSRALEARRGKIAVQILLGRLTDANVEDGIDLFDRVEVLAESLGIDVEMAQEPYDAFVAARDARLKYRELVAAFRAEDVSMVEALLRDESAFDGYTPTEMPIADIRTWAEGVRVRERLDGLVDGNRDVVETGNSTRRRFMMKRTGVTDAIAVVIDEDIPRELRAVKGLRDAMKNLGEFVPPALLTLLGDAEGRAAVLAKSLIDQTDPKMKIGEYAAAFLPKDVRVEGEDAWEMLVRMAASAVVPAEPAPVDPEPVEAAEAPQVVETPVPEAAVPAAADIAVPDRIRMNTPIPFKGARTYQEVLALNIEKEVGRIPKVSFDQDKFFNQQRMALKGYLGARTDQLVTVEDSTMFVSIPGKDGSILGRVRIPAKALSFVWYEQPGGVWFKEADTGEIRKLKEDSVERSAASFLNSPNGDPETVIGFVLMSVLVTPDGLTSSVPFVEKMGPRYSILGVNDSVGLCGFMQSIAEL